MPGSDLVQSLLRGLELLQITATEPEGLTLSEITQRSGLQKSTVYNLLRTLCAKGFLEKNAQNRFCCGIALNALVLDGKNAALLERAAAALQHIQQKYPDDVLIFAALENGAVKVKLRFSPDNPGKVQYLPNRNFPPYLSVTALALQAANPDQSDLIKQQYPWEEYGEAIWGDEEFFNEELQKIARQGFCWRQKPGQWAAAFILPEGFVLGFSFSGTSAMQNTLSQVELRQMAAKEFQSMVW